MPIESIGTSSPSEVLRINSGEVVSVVVYTQWFVLEQRYFDRQYHPLLPRLHRNRVVGLHRKYDIEYRSASPLVQHRYSSHVLAHRYSVGRVPADVARCWTQVQEDMLARQGFRDNGTMAKVLVEQSLVYLEEYTSRVNERGVEVWRRGLTTLIARLWIRR
ncbi:hypothetical protein OROMI_024374 [Orobanche minor]